MNAQYKTGVPDDLAICMDEEAAADGWSWQAVYKFLLWLGLVAIEDIGGLRKAEAALGGELPKSSHGLGRQIKVPAEARDLVNIAKREEIDWPRAQRIALVLGLQAIKGRGGVAATKRQTEALRRSVVTQAFGTRPGHFGAN